MGGMYIESCRTTPHSRMERIDEWIFDHAYLWLLVQVVKWGLLFVVLYRIFS